MAAPFSSRLAACSTCVRQKRDLCPLRSHKDDYQAAWLDTEFRAWLAAVPAHKVVGVAGNHDWVFQRRPDLVPRQYSDGADQAALHREVEAIFASRTRDEWQAALGDRDVCCEPVLELDEVRTHPHVRARGLLLEQPTPEGLLSAVARHGVTICSTAPTAYRAMLPHLAGARIRARVPAARCRKL